MLGDSYKLLMKQSKNILKEYNDSTFILTNKIVPGIGTEIFCGVKEKKIICIQFYPTPGTLYYIILIITS